MLTDNIAIEFSLLVIGLYIAWELRLLRRAFSALVVEMQTTRWERGVRDGLAREALAKLGPGWAPTARPNDQDGAP